MKIKSLIEKYSRIMDETGSGHLIQIYREILNDLLDCENELEKTKLLLVEDGSIDLGKEEKELNQLGYKVIVYRQGANIPVVVKSVEE